VLRVIDVLHESIVNELSIDGKLSRDRAITTNGTVAFGLERQGTRAMVVWTYGRERYQISYPKDSRLHHLSKDFVAFMNRSDHRLTVKNFKNEVMAEVSFAALARLGVEYLISFNPRGTLEVVTYHNGKLRVQHTDVETLPTDAKRWELLGERQRAERLEEQTEAILSRHDERQDEEHFDQYRYRLGEEVDAYGQDNPLAKPAPPPLVPAPTSRDILPAPLDLEVLEAEKPVSPAANAPLPRFSSRSEAREALERLRMSYVAGELNREDYHNQKASIERALSALAEAPVAGEGPPRTLSISSE
jgi:hypothetical protein